MKFKDPWRLPVCQGLQQWTPGPRLRQGCYTSVPQLVGGMIWKGVLGSCQASGPGEWVCPPSGAGPQGTQGVFPLRVSVPRRAPVLFGWVAGLISSSSFQSSGLTSSGRFGAPLGTSHEIEIVTLL